MIGRVLGVVIAVSVVGAGALGCKKELTVDDCKDQCKKIGDEARAKCTEAKEICDPAKTKGDESCHKTCDLAFQK